jgi:hypothetical protein
MNVVTLQCSTYTNVNDIFYATQNKKIAMILEENDYYEPIELKQRGKTPLSLFDSNGLLSVEIKNIMHQCPQPYSNDGEIYSRERVFLENIRTLISWIELRLFSSSAFTIRSIILRQDLKIYGFMTRSNLLIRGPQEGVSIHILNELLAIVPSNVKIIHIEDISNKQFTISEIFKNDFILFYNKLQDLGLILNTGTILTDNDSLLQAEEVLVGTITIEPLNMTILPVIRTRVNDSIYTNLLELTKIDKKWYQLQNAIGNTLLTNYNTLVEPLLTKSVKRKDRIRILMNTFPSIPDKVKVQHILEDIPLEYGKDALIHWLRTIGLEKRSRIYVSNFVENGNNKKEWIFSQAAVEHGLPYDVIKPADSIHPNEKFANNRIIEYDNNKRVSLSTNLSLPLPNILQKSLHSVQQLPSKWNQIKNYSWNKFVWYKISTDLYSQRSIPELFEWISTNTHIPFLWTDVVSIRNKMIIGFLQNKNKELMIKLFEDPALLKVWLLTLNKKYKDGSDMWNNKLNTYNSRELVALWKDVLTSHSDKMWPMELDFKIVVTLMNISILIIYRSKYGEGVVTEKRGNIEDLYISSTFYHGSEKDLRKRPCIIFYKVLEKDKVVFSPIIHTTNDVFIHKTVDSMPEDIQELLEYHIKKESNHDDESSSSTTSSK